MNNDIILIVDDDPDLCDSLESILKEEGYQTFCASTCAEGSKLARLRKPRVVLLDQRLPDGSGTELLAELNQDYVSQDRVVVSGNCVTAQGPGVALEFALKLVELLWGPAQRDEVGSAMLVK